jgi:hypothetical protein
MHEQYDNAELAIAEVHALLDQYLVGEKQKLKVRASPLYPLIARNTNRDTAGELLMCLQLPFSYKDKETYVIVLPADRAAHAKLPPEYKKISETSKEVRCDRIPDSESWALRSCGLRRYHTPVVLHHVQKLRDAEHELQKVRSFLLHQARSSCFTRSSNQIKDGLFEECLRRFDQSFDKWKAAIWCLSELDCLLSLAVYAASTRRFCAALCSRPALSVAAADVCRPEVLPVAQGPLLELESSRHPTLDRYSSGPVIPNDIYLGGQHPPIILLTGFLQKSKGKKEKKNWLNILHVTALTSVQDRIWEASRPYCVRRLCCRSWRRFVQIHALTRRLSWCAGWQLRACETVPPDARGSDLHADRRARQHLRGPEHVHGGAHGDERHPAQCLAAQPGDPRRARASTKSQTVEETE